MNNSGKTILVTGATGHQGGAVARHLLQRGFAVHALVRDANKPAAQSLQQAGALLVEGNLNTMTETAAVFSLVTGKTVAYQNVPFEVFEQIAGKETTSMFRWFGRVGYDADLAGLKREFGELTSLEPYLRAHGWASTGIASTV